jgi:exodeoxyribonuclease VII large subunit
MYFRIISYLDSQSQLISSILSRPVLASPFGFVDAQADIIKQHRKRLGEILDWRISKAEAELGNLVSSVRALSPQLTLERGYALVTDQNGAIIRELKAGENFTLQLSKQEIEATANKVRNK